MSAIDLNDLDLTSRLMQALTPTQARLLSSIVEQADSQHVPLYIVGGFVRDLLLGCPSLDFDLVVEGDAISLASKVVALHGGKVTIHSRFKTAQWIPPADQGFPKSIDFISARSESYKQAAALPAVKTGKLIDDLRRRDFTINTLAVQLNRDHFGHLMDYLDGLEDLNQGLIRVIHPNSFRDDPTRIFRAIRYEMRYSFKIGRETEGLIPEAREMVAHLSAERVRHELDLILEEEKAELILERLSALGILEAVHPLLKWNEVINNRFIKGRVAMEMLENPISHRTLGWNLWLIDTPLTGLESIEKRLHFETGLKKMLLAASSLYSEIDSLANMRPSQYTAILDSVPINAIQAVFLALADCPTKLALEKYLVNWRHVKPRTSGSDLKNRGLKPGPAYQVILRHLRNAWLDGEITSHEQEMEFLSKLLEENRDMTSKTSVRNK
jgi:tRNA nucleotidyltransferase (CCA-adding enzyme)